MRGLLKYSTFLALSCCAAWLVWANCVNPLFSTGGSGNLARVVDGFGSAAAISVGISSWQTCSQYGVGFPALTTAALSADFDIFVFNAGPNLTSNACGKALPLPSGNWDIQLHTHATDRSGNLRACPSLGETMAHELGHVFGLGESPCAGYIMSTAAGSTVQPGECSAVDAQWVTVIEEAPEGPITDPDNPNPHEGPSEDPATPIVIDVAGNGFRFSGPDSPVAFDLNADGVREILTWTSSDADEAFLALDRNANGTIDDGSELFGAVTAQPVSDDPNGFAALAVFDEIEHGGDQDGWITPADGVWHRLWLWRDRNHDGVSQPIEISSPSMAGIDGIELTPVISKRRDRHGNILRWMARVRRGQRMSLDAGDVIFLSP